MKTLVVFYSYGNNTRTLARTLKESINADLVDLQPVMLYTTNYQELVASEEKKKNQKEIVPIKEVNILFSKYDRIILGTPVWWYQITPVMRSFLTKYQEQLKAKEVYAFITNGGWIGHAKEEMESYVPLKKCLSLEFDGNAMRKQSKEEFDNFVREMESL